MPGSYRFGVHEPRWRLHLAERAREPELLPVRVAPPPPAVICRPRARPSRTPASTIRAGRASSGAPAAGSVYALNTSARGALNERVTCTSRSLGIVTCAFSIVIGMSLSPSLSVTEFPASSSVSAAASPAGVRCSSSSSPSRRWKFCSQIAAIPLEPPARLGERPAFDPPRPPLRVLADADQAGPLEHLQVLRDRQAGSSRTARRARPPTPRPVRGAPGWRAASGRRAPGTSRRDGRRCRIHSRRFNNHMVIQSAAAMSRPVAVPAPIMRGRRGGRLDVDDRRAVDGFDGPNPQAGSDHAPDGDRMQANRIRPIRRACREHACERAPLVVPRVNPEHVTPGLVQPRDDDEPVTCGDSLERWTERLAHLQPRVGCAFDPLPRCLRARSEPRANHADRSKLGTSVGLCDGFPSDAGTGCPSHACVVSSAGFTQAVLSES